MANVQLFQLLKKDHQEIDQLLGKMAKTKGEKERIELLKDLEVEATIHMGLEEKLFYPELQKLQETKELASEALEEHEEARQLLKSLKALHADSEGWLPALEKLTDAIQHHVKEEEGEVFPASEKALGPQVLQAIGERFQEEKRTKMGMKAGATTETTRRT